MRPGICRRGPLLAGGQLVCEVLTTNAMPLFKYSVSLQVGVSCRRGQCGARLCSSLECMPHPNNCGGSRTLFQGGAVGRPRHDLPNLASLTCLVWVPADFHYPHGPDQRSTACQSSQAPLRRHRFPSAHQLQQPQQHVHCPLAAAAGLSLGGGTFQVTGSCSAAAVRPISREDSERGQTRQHRAVHGYVH